MNDILILTIDVFSIAQLSCDSINSSLLQIHKYPTEYTLLAQQCCLYSYIDNENFDIQILCHA